MNSVIEPVEKSWHELDDLVESLGPDVLTMTGTDGWAVKDHLIHVAAWEHSLIALLQGSDRWAAMGVARDVDGTDEINAAVWAMHRDKPADACVDYFHQTHALLMQVLGTLTDADLKKPYNHYQPNDPRDPHDDRPALDWVAGNTYDHYAEHIGWIKAIQH